MIASIGNAPFRLLDCNNTTHIKKKTKTNQMRKLMIVPVMEMEYTGIYCVFELLKVGEA